MGWYLKVGECALERMWCSFLWLSVSWAFRVLVLGRALLGEEERIRRYLLFVSDGIETQV